MRATSLSLFLVALAKAQNVPVVPPVDPAAIPDPADVVVDPAAIEDLAEDLADVVTDLPESGAIVVDPADVEDLVNDLIEEVDTPVVVDPADVEDDPSAIEETLDDVAGAFSDLFDNVTGDDSCFGAYA